jgi:hypothetical protein
MCFSATASFVVAAALVPAGLVTVTRARAVEPAWTAFAAFPLAFGLQQAIEGVVWLGIESGDAGLVAGASRGFLFFSHFFWLAFVPFAVWLLEPPGPRRPVLLGLTATGALFGLSIFLPSFLVMDRLAVEVTNHNIAYRTRLIYEGFVPRMALEAFYGLIVVTALLLSSDRRIRIFAGLIAVSLVLAYGAFAHAFISVWCYFAAVLSAYLVAVTRWRVPVPDR